MVVVGILIALQINNWNDERKDRLLETKIVKEIVSNLNIDLKEIRDDIAHMDSVNLACRDIIRFMETDSAPSESFSNLYETSYPYYRRYEEERTMFKLQQKLNYTFFLIFKYQGWTM